MASVGAHRQAMPHAVCRRLSSSSESGFNSDLSDDHNASPPAVVDEVVHALNGYIECGSKSEEEQESLRMAHELVADVVDSMMPERCVAKVRPYSCRHSATLVRIVHELSSKHEIVFESIARKLRLQVNGHRDAELCRRTFTGVVDELFADGRYNWGRVVTVFAYAGWLARAGNADAQAKASEIHVNSWSDIVIDIAGDYIGRKLSHWICQQGGWDAMDRFFVQPVPFETKLWQGLLYTFFGLGALATMAAIVR